MKSFKLELTREEAQIVMTALEKEGYYALGLAAFASLNSGQVDTKKRRAEIVWSLFDRVKNGFTRKEEKVA